MKKSKFISILLLLLVLASSSLAQSENLDEVIARIARQSSASWGYATLENASNNYIWQPEGLSYKDISTGKEVWRISPSSGAFNVLSDISYPSWSADGKRFSYRASRHTAAWTESSHNLDYGIWMVMLADGSMLRPLPNAPARTGAHSGYQHWSPILPDVYYQFGRNYVGENCLVNDLYKVAVTDISETKNVLISFPDIGAEIGLKKAISADGTRVMASNILNEAIWFPATVYPDASAGLDVANGYPTNRPSYDDYWLNTAARKITGYNQYHDQFLCGAGNNIWYYIMPEDADGSWWRIRLTGSETDGGPKHTADHTYPYNWGGEMEPLSSNSSGHNRPYCSPGVTTDGKPDCTGYWSHVGFDRWGTKAVFSKAEGPYPYGVGAIDIEGEYYWDVSDFGDGALHHDWHAWSDWSASSAEGPAGGHANRRILTQNWTDASSSTILCSAHISAAGDYNRLARPTQSPDGTKVNWHSTFLNNSDSNSDLFYVVAYYPYPPQVTEVSAFSGKVSVSVDWRLNTSTPRGYTARGWPNDTDIAPPPREIAKFRLWRSNDQTNWTPLTTVEHDIFTRFDFVNGGFKAGQSEDWILEDTPGDGTWYYAVTSSEHSGLESHVLSNIFSVNLSGGNGTGSESTVYPSKPGDDSDFYLSLPNPVTDVVHDHQKAPASASGQYTIEWNRVENDLVRHYNIYAEDGAKPDLTQQNRIASLPASAFSGNTCSWIDCFGNTSGTTQYSVTCVDYLGNESVGDIVSSVKNPVDAESLFDFDPVVSSDRVQFMVKLGKTCDLEFHVYDITGKKLLQMNKKRTPKGVHTFDINQKIPNGIYVAKMYPKNVEGKIALDKQKVIKKFVISR